MKYPEYRLSMEAALPSSVHSWLKLELEHLGIDSLVYSRYIISLMLQDGEDLDGLDMELDMLSQSKQKGHKLNKQKLSVSNEERKKFAAIQCLSAVTDEKSSIEALVEELCVRLKDSGLHATVSPVVKSHSCTCDCSDDSATENQNPVQRYYAAFPALHQQVTFTNTSPTDTVWKKNPLTKPFSTSEEDCSSAHEDAEIKKINIPCPLAVPKHRKPHKTHSRNKKDLDENHHKKHHNEHYKRDCCKCSNRSLRERKVQKLPAESREIPPWPPGFVKQDPLILQSLGLLDPDINFTTSESPKWPRDDLCIKVESLLKGFLLPIPDKRYKDLQDVTDDEPLEMYEKVRKPIRQLLVNDNNIGSSTAPVSTKEEGKLKSVYLNTTEVFSNNNKIDLVTLSEDNIIDRMSPGSHDESVSPELQEHEIWYTQPMHVLLYTHEDNEMPDSKQKRLYKRSSTPRTNSDAHPVGKQDLECNQSTASSPVVTRSATISVCSEGDDGAWEGSVLIPAWLTEVISTEEHGNDDNKESTSPLGPSSSHDEQFNGSSKRESGLVQEEKMEGLDLIWGNNNDRFADRSNPDKGNNDDSGTPVPENDDGTPTPDQRNVSRAHDKSPDSRPVLVSLVDLEYITKFLCDVDLQTLGTEDDLHVGHTRRMSALWQSKILFDLAPGLSDFIDSFYELYDIHGWRPIGTSPFSQLWDVNMQKQARISTWGLGWPVLSKQNQIWLAENRFVFLHEISNTGTRDQGCSENENTLIPRISFDITSEYAPDRGLFLQDENDVPSFIDRSYSMGDVPSMWDDYKHDDIISKLSTSFELVPSEHSAFNDVPRKLLHVHSEPNLVQFRQGFSDLTHASAHSPQEHLYFSAKTHFRPITPAYAPELFMSKSKQQVCNDLFGGVLLTKTPYQQYHVIDYASDEEGFVPSFKVKNYSKSIQTGESFDKSDTSEVAAELVVRDTPETLTLSIIEDVMAEKDNSELQVTASDDLDMGNTDSAYETDYGGYAGLELEQDINPCVENEKCLLDTCQPVDYQNFVNPAMFDNGMLGNCANFSINNSLLATYPHTQDWPDTHSHSQDSPETCQVTYPQTQDWPDLHPHTQDWPETCLLFDQPDEPWNFLEDSPWIHHKALYSFGNVSQCKQPDHNTVEDGSKFGSSLCLWGDGFGLDHLYSEHDVEKYKNIWSTAGQNYCNIELSTDAGTTISNFEAGNFEEEYAKISDNVPVEFQLESFSSDRNDVLGYHLLGGTPENVDSSGVCETVDEQCHYFGYGSFYEHDDFLEMTLLPDISEMGLDENYPEIGMSSNCPEVSITALECTELCAAPDPGQYSVKLVYWDKQNLQGERNSQQKLYGTYELMPMPEEAVMLADLENQYTDDNLRAMWALRKPSGVQRKPCSFYLEGNCRRADCKFAHDISNITCRFWEEGGCFKGPLCPFLHGYPSLDITSVSEPVSRADNKPANFDLNSDDFPDLCHSMENGNNSSSRKKAKTSKPQAMSSKRDKSRRGSGHCHSNKERCDVQINGMCSSSI